MLEWKYMGANTSAASTADVQQVLDGIRRIVQALREASRESEHLTGLTAAQLFVLRRLSEMDGASINQLAARTFTHQSSVSVVVSRLVARKLVERRNDPRDRRRRRLTITGAGRRALMMAPAAAQERLIDAVVQLPGAARKTVARTLAAIADGMVAERTPSMFFEDRARS